MIKHVFLCFFYFCAAAVARDKYTIVICSHPEDENKSPGHSLTTCRGATGGHPFSDVHRDGDTVAKCQNCAKAHPASPNLCKIKEIKCTVQGDTEEEGGDGYTPKVITIEKR